MSTAMAYHDHHARIDTHRVTLIQQESCATEGLCCNGDCRQGRDCPMRTMQSEEDDSIGVKLGLWSVLLVAIGAFVALVWP